jgi:hypothetical protein
MLSAIKPVDVSIIEYVITGHEAKLLVQEVEPRFNAVLD